MPRPLRIIYPNACYHVMNRGAGRKRIFMNNHQRTIFINLLHDCCKLFNIKVYAYCLMDNHYHLLISTPDANLPRVMRHLNGVYTQKFNYLMKKDGSLFRGRYHAKLVDEDSYRLLLTRYIHFNPVEAGIVQDPALYRWSSYRAYLGLSEKCEWLSITDITNQLRETTSLSHVKNYQDYVEGISIEELNTFKSTKFTSPVVGSASFKEKSLQKISSADTRSYSSDLNQIKSNPTIEFIMEMINTFYKIDRDTLISTKPGKTNLPKLVFIYICNKKFGHKLRDIAEFAGFSRYESVSSAVRTCQIQLNKSSNLAEQVNKITVLIENALSQTQ